MFAFAATPTLMTFTMAIALYLLGMGLINPLGTSIALHPFGGQPGRHPPCSASCRWGAQPLARRSRAFCLLQPSASLAVRQGKGKIVNLSSVLGLIPAPYSALYASTKHAIEGYSESLGHELRPFGIRVVLVEPAYTRTSFEDNLAKPDQLLDIYDSARAGMNVILRKAMATGDAPTSSPGRYWKQLPLSAPGGAMRRAKWQVSFLRRFVPESAFDKSLRKQNGLPA